MNELQNIDLKQLIENETGQAFTRDNKICCPFHSEKSPSFSVRFNSDNNKWQWKCFGVWKIKKVIKSLNLKK